MTTFLFRAAVALLSAGLGLLLADLVLDGSGSTGPGGGDSCSAS